MHIARQKAIPLDNILHPVTFNKIVVNLFGCLHLHAKALAVRRKLHGASGIEKQSVALWRHQHRYHHLEIVLSEPQGLSHEVHIVLHVGTESIQSLGVGA